jgi:hypothetical protein
VSPEIVNLVARGFHPDEAELVHAAGAAGLITHEEWQAVKNGHYSYADIAGAIFARSAPAHDPEHEHLSGLGQDDTYMSYDSTLVPPADTSSTYMDYSNVFTPPTLDNQSAQLIPINLTAGSQYPIPQSYASYPSTLTPPSASANPGLAQSIAALANAGANVAQAAGSSSVNYLTPTQRLQLQASSAHPSAAAAALTSVEQSLASIPTWAIVAAVGALAFGVMKR